MNILLNNNLRYYSKKFSTEFIFHNLFHYIYQTELNFYLFKLCIMTICITVRFVYIYSIMENVEIKYR